jgi:hypothetical protein
LTKSLKIAMRNIGIQNIGIRDVGIRDSVQEIGIREGKLYVSGKFPIQQIGIRVIDFGNEPTMCFQHNM